MLYIHPEECIDCGACEPVRPVDAIFMDEEVPENGKTSPSTTTGCRRCL